MVWMLQRDDTLGVQSGQGQCLYLLNKGMICVLINLEDEVGNVDI